MNTRIIEERLKQYTSSSPTLETQGIREITQELILFSLSTSDFCTYTRLSRGEHCLRIVHGLNRFFEDMDFILEAKRFGALLGNPALPDRNDLGAIRVHGRTRDKSQVGDTVKNVFIKDDSIGKILRLSYADRRGPPRRSRSSLR
ncbi:MAG: hypothetical protein MZV63_07290 [Marinilabiliales bacterium]|nr:hypothetical protein [Marinilabiliales bacterium]